MTRTGRLRIREIRRDLVQDCARLCGVEPAEVELVLKTVYKLYRNEIEDLLLWYSKMAPPNKMAGSTPMFGALDDDRRWLVVQALAACNKPRDPFCPKQTEPGWRGFFDICPGCEDAFSAFKAGGNARNVVIRYVRQDLERIVVSEWLDGIVGAVISAAMKVEDDAEVLRGCTLYLAAREIGYRTGGQGLRLSDDLKYLINQVPAALGQSQRLGITGSGLWVLNDVSDWVLQHRGVIGDLLFSVSDWPQYPDDWESLGSYLSLAYPGKFKRR